MGELGFLTPDNKRTQTVKCTKSGDVLTIEYDRLLEFYFQYPELGNYFLRLTTNRLLQNNVRLQGLVEQLLHPTPCRAKRRRDQRSTIAMTGA